MAPPKCHFTNDDYESHDIAILELEKEVDLSNGESSPAVGPICLPEAGEVKSLLCSNGEWQDPVLAT